MLKYKRFLLFLYRKRADFKKAKISIITFERF